MQDIVVQFKWIADELVAAQKWHSRTRMRRPFRIALWVIAIFMLVPGFFLCLIEGDWLGIFLIGFGLLIIGSMTFIPPLIIRSQFRHRPDNGIDIERRISAERIHVLSALGDSEINWQSFWKIVECPDGFLFYQFAQLFHWVPRHGFASDADWQHVVHFAKQSGVPFITITS
jgi:hypothetical protein